MVHTLGNTFGILASDHIMRSIESHDNQYFSRIIHTLLCITNSTGSIVRMHGRYTVTIMIHDLTFELAQ